MDLEILTDYICCLCNKWDGIRTRLRDPHYKARKIGCCKEWLNGKDGRKKFILWALENGFAPGLDLDRIDNNSGYSPSNCRWVTRSINLRNTSRAKFVEYRGEVFNMKTLSEHPDCVVPYYLLKMRLKSGWPVEEAVTRQKSFGCAWERGSRKRKNDD